MIPVDSENFSLNYSFTTDEIRILAKFLREKEIEVPEGLERFIKALEDSVYKSLTLDQIRRFYS